MRPFRHTTSLLAVLKIQSYTGLGNSKGDENSWQVKSDSVPRGRNGMGQERARCVHGLKYAVEVDPPRDLLNEHGRKPLGSQLLMDAQKVDLDTGNALSVDAEPGRNGRDECNHPSVLRDAHRDGPGSSEIGRLQGPEK